MCLLSLCAPLDAISVTTQYGRHLATFGLTSAALPCSGGPDDTGSQLSPSRPPLWTVSSSGATSSAASSTLMIEQWLETPVSASYEALERGGDALAGPLCRLK